MKITLRSLPTDKSVWPSSYMLNPGSTLIGRNPNCNLTLDCATISGWHCIVDVAPNAIYITDLHSTNGTYVNDRRAMRQRLHNADQLRLADLSFVVDANSSEMLPVKSEAFEVSALPCHFSQLQMQTPRACASAISDLLPQALGQRSAVSSSNKAPGGLSDSPADVAQQMACYGQAMRDCTAQLRVLTEKIVSLEIKLNAIERSGLGAGTQNSPRKAFEQHDAMMYVARAAVHEKARQEGVALRSASS